MLSESEFIEFQDSQKLFENAKYSLPLVLTNGKKS